MKTMKKLKTSLALLVPVLTILAMALVGCSSNSGGGGGSSTCPTCETTPAAGEIPSSLTKKAPVKGEHEYSADSVTFKTTRVDFTGLMAFPTNTDDSGVGVLLHGFEMAQTETTYELWHKVKTWATANGYNFQNAGKEGNDGGSGTPTAAKNEPVTTISWRDSVVWCNALTEWYNEKAGKNLTLVYTDADGNALKDSRDANATKVDAAKVKADATGFRLPTSAEWEFAARYQGTTDKGNSVSLKFSGQSYFFGKGNSASGATKDYTDATETGKVAWYGSNSGGKSHNVKEKTANALGIFDMSGNVSELCFDIVVGPSRVLRGGGWNYFVSPLQVGYVGFVSPADTSSYLGFRVVRTQ